MSQKITEVDRFLAFINKLLKKELEQREFARLEKINIKVSIYDIFQRNYSVETIYYDLLELLEEDNRISFLLPEIKNYYNNLKV